MPESTSINRLKRTIPRRPAGARALVLQSDPPRTLLSALGLLALLALFLLALSGPFAAHAAEGTPRYIDAAELAQRLNDPALFIVDVRTEASWRHSPRKIPGAVRIDPRDLGNLAQQVPRGHEVVLYCA